MSAYTDKFQGHRGVPAAPAPTLPCRFFFYGTLMEDGGALRSAVPRELGMKLVGPAKVRGDLYAVGSSFPALMKGEGVVTGQLWETDDELTARMAFARFDTIEGFNPHRPESSMYLREQVELLEPAGVEVFTYFWNRQAMSRSYLSRIASGDWRRWLAEPHESLTGRRPR